MSGVDSPFDPGADSCLNKSAKLLGLCSLLSVLLVRIVRRAVRRG